MSKHTDDELYQVLAETGRLLRDAPPVEGEEYSLDSILAEFGQGAAEPAPPQQPPASQTPAPPPAERESPAPRRPVLSLIRGGLGKRPAPPEDPDDTRQIPPEDPDDTRRIPPKSSRPAPPPPSRAPQPPRPDASVFPDEPEGMHKVPLEQVMSQTVESVLDEDDSILEKPAPLSRRIGEALASWRVRLSALLARREKSAPSPWEQPEEEPEQAEEPEPDMELAARDAKRLCKKLHLHVTLSALPAGLLLVLTAADVLGMPGGLQSRVPLLRYAAPGALLLLTALLSAPLWAALWRDLKAGRPGCELAAGCVVPVTLADCVYGALGHGGQTAPFAASAAALVWLCQLGLLLAAESRREAFHLADIGGAPPYGVSVTAVGACKQKGTIDGFYRNAFRPDPSRTWQRILVPLYLAAATVLSGVVILSRRTSADPLWIWSALLSATAPLSLPLTGTLPLKFLNHRLVKSGSAVAGYHGARSVSRSRRMVVTDDDLFPPGTVGLNGLKVYGEEIGKVVSCAASITQACHSQLHPLFEQLLAAEGGAHLPVEDLHYYEEGGVGGTIRGESVTMGSAYFMRKTHVALPQDLKLKTGVFLAVDGTLIAIFAIKYAPSRNVEWALRVLRRNRIEPVLAVRSCNVTPGLLKRRFSLNVKPVYPDVSTRLALSDLSRETAQTANAIIYREGLMPFAETAVGSRRMTRSVLGATVLAWLGGLCGLLLTYYLTGAGAVELLDPLRMLLFQGLWLLPTLLLSSLVKHY